MEFACSYYILHGFSPGQVGTYICLHACVDGYLSVCGPVIICPLVKDVTPGYSTSAGIENE